MIPLLSMQWGYTGSLDILEYEVIEIVNELTRVGGLCSGVPWT
jgi:hypothetical protein